MPEWIGQTIGKVRIEKYLTRGGMAEVYLGTHLTLDRPVAVKVMHSYIESEPELQTRFQREAKAVAGLRHPNIVQIFDFDTYEGHPYIVMEYLKGPSLSTYLRALHENNRKLPFDEIAHLLRPIASAIDYAHSQGIIHRDIKPANILLHTKKGEFTEDQSLTKDIEPILTDFGLVRITHSGTQTASGIVSGTPAYMSPEQARGSKVDERTDIYSLGVVLYELLAGRVPFEGDTNMDVILKHINEPPPAIENIPSELQAVINKALAKEPNDRYQNGTDLTSDFFNAVGLYAEATTIHSVRTRTSKPTVNPVKKKASVNPLWIIAGIFACACISIFLLSTLGITAISLFPNKGPMSLTPGGTYSNGDGNTMDSGSPHQGVLRFQDGTATLDQITISAALTAPKEGTQYEAWLVSDGIESRRNLGVLTLNSHGQFTVNYVDPESHNLLSDFNRMEITVEPNPDDSPNPSGEVAYSSEIPAKSLVHIKHLLVKFDSTPNQVALAIGLVNTSTAIKKSADDMLAAYQAGKISDVRANAEAIVNMIVGKKAIGQYQDWDGNKKINDFGDGFGLLLNGSQSGYIGNTIDHAKLAADASDSTPDIRMHSEHVIICAQNVEDWSTQLRDLAIRIAQSDPKQIVEADVRTAAALANQILNGVDIDGSETIDPIPGEGGAITAFEHADYMSDMPILPGEHQVPVTGQ